MADGTITDFDVYKPFSAGAGSNPTEPDYREMARHWIPSGVLLSAITDLQVYANSSGRQCFVRAGKIWIDGFFGSLTSDKTITLSPNVSGVTRTDSIVARMNPATGFDKIQIVVREGTPGAVTLTQNLTGTYELLLATIPVINGYTTVAATDVTDTRPIAKGIDGRQGPMMLLDRVALTSDTAGPIVFTNFPNTLKDLQIRATARSSQAVTAASVSLQVNSETGTIYDYVNSQNVDGTATDTAQDNQTSATIGRITGNSTTGAGRFGRFIADLLYANSSSQIPTFHSRSWLESDTNQPEMYLLSGELPSVATNTWPNGITSLSLSIPSGNFKAGTEIRLYGG